MNFRRVIASRFLLHRYLLPTVFGLRLGDLCSRWVTHLYVGSCSLSPQQLGTMQTSEYMWTVLRPQNGQSVASSPACSSGEQVCPDSFLDSINL